MAESSLYYSCESIDKGKEELYSFVLATGTAISIRTQSLYIESKRLFIRSTDHDSTTESDSDPDSECKGAQPTPGCPCQQPN